MMNQNDIPVTTGPLELPTQSKKTANGTLNSGRDVQAANGNLAEPKATLLRPQYSLVLGLSSVNGTFEKKSLVLPAYPEVMRLGRQTSAKTLPAPDNGYFDSRVLSRYHAEIWADYNTRKVWIRDSKSSNGTYVNGLRLGDDKGESEPHELNKNDIVELGIDIANDEGTSFVHRRISAKVDRISYLSLQAKRPPSQQDTFQNTGHLGNALTAQKSKLNGARSSRTAAEGLDVALFGDIDASLEDISLSHARSSVTGRFMNSGVAFSATMELIVKKLVGEIHQAKVESAKIRSVQKLLSEIYANQQTSKVLLERLPSLSKYKEQVSELTEQLQTAQKEIQEKDQHIRELERTLTLSMEKNSLTPINRTEETETGTETPTPTSPTSQASPLSTSVPKSPSHVKPPKTPDVEKLSAVLAELEETKNDLSSFKERALAAEELASRQSKKIGELTAASSKATPASPATPLTGITVTMASALSVVVVGISFMAVLNSFSRDSLKNLS